MENMEELRDVLQKIEAEANKNDALTAEGIDVLKKFLSGEADEDEIKEQAIRFLINSAENEELTLSFGLYLNVIHNHATTIMAMAIDMCMTLLDGTDEEWEERLGVTMRSSARDFGDALFGYIPEHPKRGKPGMGWLQHMYHMGTRIHDAVCVTLGVLSEYRDLWLQTSDSEEAAQIRASIAQAMADASENENIAEAREKLSGLDKNLN